MELKNLNTKLIMPLNRSQFESLKYLIGINYPADTISLTVEENRGLLEHFLGTYMRNVNDTEMIIFRIEKA